MEDSNPSISVSAAAKRLKVSPSTVQRMCNRGLLKYAQTRGGHRRIVLSDLLEHVQELHGETHRSMPSQRTQHQHRTNSFSKLSVEQIAELLCKGAQDELLSWIFGGSLNHQDIIRKLDGHLLRAIIDLGNQYSSRQIKPYQLWLAMNTTAAALEKLTSTIACPESPVVRAVGGSPEGDCNRLGVCFVEAALQLSGIRARSLGQGLTAREMADAADTSKASIVFVSHTHIENANSVIGWHRELATLLPANVRILVGGGALSPSLRHQLPAHVYYPSLGALFDAEALVQHTRTAKNGWVALTRL